MTNSTPPDPFQPSEPESPQPRRPAVTFDELVAIIVAFTAIGAIFFFSVGRRTVLPDLGLPVEPSGEADEGGIPAAILNLFEEPSPSDAEFGSDGEAPSQPEPREQPLGGFGENESDRPLTSTLPLAPGIPVTPEASTPSPVAAPSEPVTPSEETPLEPTTPSAVEEVPSEPAEENVAAGIPDDVPSSYWAYPFIAPLAQEELLVGLADNQFAPDETVTREQLAVQIDEAFRQQANQDFINFEDISQNSTTAQRIDEAVETGFLRGYPNQTFRPDQPVPRVQVLVALVSGLALEPSQNPDEILGGFQDAEEIPDWAREKVAAATEAGLVVNRPDFESDSLYPNEPATRAEVAAMIHQGLVQANRLSSISSEYIIDNP